ncbi:hypothetical protein GCM10010095_79980 [Streptomyces anthocyanicus]|nr:hypothetical protein GCM10010095_79980 [Streptomyces anthocyanicus]
MVLSCGRVSCLVVRLVKTYRPGEGKGVVVVDHLVSPAMRWKPARAGVLRPVVWLPIGTNGYVSSWGATASVCPPKGR